jgi:hypothetical protein
MDVSSEKKCVEILQFIIEICNENKTSDPVISFGADWGGNSLIIHLMDKGHSRAGRPEGSFEELVDEIHDLLNQARGK